MKKISIIGLGKLGSPMAAVFASKGYSVVGVDKNPKFVELMNKGVAPVEEPQLQELVSQFQSNLKVTLDIAEAVKETEATFVIVPTPSQKSGFFTNQYVLEAIKEIGNALKGKSTYHLVVVTSTVMPGSMDQEILPALEKSSSRKVGESIGLCYSPEFIALGSVVRDMLNPDFYLIGESDERAGDLLQSIYLNSCNNSPRVERMNFVNAELTKISVNTYVTTKISYANMLSEICDHLEGADVDVVTQAVGCDSRIGHRYLKGGVAYGGPCFPRDNVAFSSLASEIGAHADIALATDSINKNQANRVIKIIQSRKKLPQKIGILGLSYKPGTAVIEESQGISVAQALSRLGYKVNVFDPLALEASKKVLGDTVHYASSLEESVKISDALVIMTAWPEFLEISLEKAGNDFFIVDCWRILDKKASPNKIIYLGNGTLCGVQKKKTLCLLEERSG